MRIGGKFETPFGGKVCANMHYPEYGSQELFETLGYQCRSHSDGSPRYDGLRPSSNLDIDSFAE
jgi:hypothetical protein